MKRTSSRKRALFEMIILALQEEVRKESCSVDNIVKNTKLYGRKVVKNIKDQEILEILNSTLISLFIEE